MKTISSWRPRSTGFSNGRTISRSYRWIRGHPPTILANRPRTGTYRVLVDPRDWTPLLNFVYNIRRLVTLERMAVA